MGRVHLARAVRIRHHFGVATDSSAAGAGSAFSMEPGSRTAVKISPACKSVAATLRSRYSEDLREPRKSVVAESKKLSVARFAESFIDCIVEFVRKTSYLGGILSEGEPAE
jgi:hypothetical protein